MTKEKDLKNIAKYWEITEDKDKRIELIKEVQDFVAFNLRFAELSENELKNYTRTIQGGYLSEEMRATLKKYEGNQEKIDYYIDMWARSNYMRECA